MPEETNETPRRKRAPRVYMQFTLPHDVSTDDIDAALKASPTDGPEAAAQWAKLLQVGAVQSASVTNYPSKRSVRTEPVAAEA